MRVEKISIITASIIFSIFFTLSQIGQNQGKSEQLLVLQNGVEVCFQRVVQSFSARLLSSGGERYLSKDFFGQTEGCFAEAIELSETLQDVVGRSSRKSINSLAESIGSFHLNLTSGSSLINSTPEELVQKNIKDKFSVLESSKDKLVESLNESFLISKNAQRNLNLLIEVLLTLSLGLIGFTLFSLWRSRSLLREIEKRAASLLSEGAHSDEAEELISRGLELSYLSDTRRLLMKAWRRITLNDLKENAQIIASAKEVEQAAETNSLETQTAEIEIEHFQRDGVENNDIQEVLISNKGVMGYANEDIGETEKNLLVDQVWNTQVEEVERAPEVETKAYDELVLDKVNQLELNINAALDSLSRELFQNGITVELDLRQDIDIELNRDILVQVFHNVINHVVRTCKYSGQKKARRLTIHTRKIASSKIIEFRVMGHTFEENFIQYFSGNTEQVDQAQAIDKHYKGLETSRALLKEEGADMVLLNDESDSNETCASIQIAINEDIKKRVKSIHKGTKKDLLEELKGTLS